VSCGSVCLPAWSALWVDIAPTLRSVESREPPDRRSSRGRCHPRPTEGLESRSLSSLAVGPGPFRRRRHQVEWGDVETRMRAARFDQCVHARPDGLDI
jgi:hypothetical protein